MENQPQENSQVRKANAAAPSSSQGGDVVETTQQTPWMNFRQLFRASYENARKSQQHGSTRREQSKDKVKSLVFVVGTAIVTLLILFSVLSSPQKAKKPETGRRPRTSDLGRRVTPGQENAQPGSVTPMLNAQMNGEQGMNNGDVTPEDVGRTARLGMGQSHAAMPAAASSQGIPEKKSQHQYALDRIQFDSALAQQPGYGVAPAYQQAPVPLAGTKTTESDELRKPSLVFVRAAVSGPAGGPAARAIVAQEPAAVLDTLPPGTRLVARLESAVSTAVKEPVIAVIEYNYERDGEIIVPAGAKAVGQLRQANRSGYVDIKFDTLEMPDGTTEKMEGVAMDMKFGPLKGDVGGKRKGTKFLVRSLTGVGTVAAYLVGGGGTGFNGPLSESALLRERVANNVGMAGDQELNDLGFNQNIVVTVHGNTRFYIVLQNVALGRSGVTQPPGLTSARPGGTNVPTLDELRQLKQLKQELSTMYQQASTQSTAAQAPQQ